MKKSVPNILTGECYQAFNEELALVFLKLFQMIEEERMLTESFCEEVNTTLTQKPNTRKRKKH
jgi:hypothetical protein